MKTISAKEIILIILMFFIVSCETNESTENSLDPDNSDTLIGDSLPNETIRYSISTDKSAYSFLDTIHWNASLANLSDDTISFDDQGTGSFFEWFMVDTFGIYLDSGVYIDCVDVYKVMPGDTLESRWTTELRFSFIKHLSSGYHYGIMKPWFNNDSIKYDTTEFFIDAFIGFNNLSINSDSTTYSWRQGESQDYISIQGTLRNHSLTTFYSKLGDGFGPSEQEQFHIVSFSDGYIEKYDESDNSWNELELNSILIEGVKVVPIKPSTDYSIISYLTKSKDESETGLYRIRIDYYETENPDSTTTKIQDYSNTFEIN